MITSMRLRAMKFSGLSLEIIEIGISAFFPIGLRDSFLEYVLCFDWVNFVPE